MNDASVINPWIRWPGYVAWAFLALIALAVLMVRSGSWQQGLALYAVAGLFSMVLLAFFAVLFLLPRLREQRPAILRRSLPALPGAALLLLAMQAGDAPPIHDITTDTQDPPRFEKASALRAPGSNSLETSPEVIAQQKSAYPDLSTLRSPYSFNRTYNLALTTARSMGWEITREDPNAGYIEAVASTPIMNFKDDVIIRIRTNEEGSLLDLRSASRVGVSDLGANAARIRSFLDAFRGAVESP